MTITKQLFFSRLNSMWVDRTKPLCDQLAGRLYQCDWVLKKHQEAGIVLTDSQKRLLGYFEKRLSVQYKYEVNVFEGEPSSNPNMFTLINFDSFIQKTLYKNEIGEEV